MRIAVLINTMTTGGAGTVAKTYDELLVARGHDVRVWTAGPEFSRLSEKNLFSRLWFHLNDLGANSSTVNDVVEWKPDVLLTHNLTGCGFGTPRSIRSAGIRWVHVLHDVQLIEPSGQIVFGESFRRLRAIWRWKWSLLRHFVMKEPNAVVSPTKWLLEFHQKFGWFKKIRTSVIPNPVPPAPAPSIARRGTDALFVGRVDADKGIFVLLDAWKKMNASSSRLVIIGDGSLLSSLKSQNLPGVEFRGTQSSEEVRRAMEESAVVVVPSLVMENQPTVILEALAAGCAVVASDVGGVRETLGDAGTIVPPNDADALARSIQNATVDEQKAKSVLESHDPEVCVQRLVDVLKTNL